MLERLVIKNFQCHDHLTIDFDPFVTTLVGEEHLTKAFR